MMEDHGAAVTTTWLLRVLEAPELQQMLTDLDRRAATSDLRIAGVGNIVFRTTELERIRDAASSLMETVHAMMLYISRAGGHTVSSVKTEVEKMLQYKLGQASTSSTSVLQQPRMF